MRCDALIIGAGPAGSSAARLLAQAGWSVVLVERSEFPRRKVCGEYLSPANLELFRQLGIAQDFLSGKIAVRRIVLMQGVNLHPARDSASSVRQSVTEGVVPFVGNADPINRAKHDGFACTLNNNASRPQPEIPFIRYGIISHVAPHRRSGIDIEGSDPYRPVCCANA